MGATAAFQISVPVALLRAESSDLPRVQALARRIWPECFAHMLSPEQISRILDEVYDLSTLVADMDERHHEFWIARVGARDAGYAAAYLQGQSLWLKKLYVEQLWRGYGIGTALIAAVQSAYPTATSVSLLVNENNHAARAFYRDQGFVERARVPVTMGPIALHDFIMSRELAPTTDPGAALTLVR